MVMSFFDMPFCGEATYMRNMGMSFCGMPLYTLDVCPENRDESNGDGIIKLWVQFIPIFGALHSQFRRGHTTKRHPHVPCKKDTSILFSIFSFSGEINKGLQTINILAATH